MTVGKNLRCLPQHRHWTEVEILAEGTSELLPSDVRQQLVPFVLRYRSCLGTQQVLKKEGMSRCRGIEYSLSLTHTFESLTFHATQVRMTEELQATPETSQIEWSFFTNWWDLARVKKEMWEPQLVATPLPIDRGNALHCALKNECDVLWGMWAWSHLRRLVWNCEVLECLQVWNQIVRRAHYRQVKGWGTQITYTSGVIRSRREPPFPSTEGIWVAGSSS